MTRVKIADLKDHLSEHLRAVERGGEIEVTDRNRPIAKISPLPSKSRRVDIVPARRRFSPADKQPLSPARWAVDSLELLLQERRERWDR
jgi:prevent-host-death family protein